MTGVIDANGALLGTQKYRPYGEARSTTGIQSDFGYAGMFYNTATGLYLTQYREYNPAVGRWLSRDPIGELGGENVYAYVGNNPLSGIDPYGLYGMDDFWYDVNLGLGQFGLRDWVPSQTTVDGVAGFGDGVSFGLSKYARQKIGGDGADYCDPIYGHAKTAGHVYDAAMVAVIAAPYVAPYTPSVLGACFTAYCTLTAGEVVTPAAAAIAEYAPETAYIETQEALESMEEMISEEVEADSSAATQQP